AAYFTTYRGLLWSEQDLTEGVRNFSRLKLLTYEPSYYATLMVPLFCFYFLRYALRQSQRPGWQIIVVIGLPYLLSFSFGVMAALLFSGLLMFLCHWRTLLPRRRMFNGIINGCLLAIVVAGIIYIVSGENFFLLRVQNILSGNDTSGNGRTVDAFFIANKLLHRRDPYWGIGLGQVKVMGSALIRNYYLYSGDFVPTIPNAAAETLAVFGWVGFMLRILVELTLFITTRVWSNYYRLWLFLFVFIYQFTGSFLTNIAEYVIWILAFAGSFAAFSVPSRAKQPIPLLQPAG
ncbi:MAG TPA: hypothetical protein VGC95_03255, partial [Chitinophagaceae bacterium]